MLKELFEEVIKGPWATIGNDVQYKIINNILYLAGTNSCIDWFTNFNFPIKLYKDQPIKWYVHRGYGVTYKSTNNYLRDLVIQNNIKTIVGYSYGAAIATLLYEDIKFNYSYFDFKTYAFGSPRVIWFYNKNKIKDRWDNFYNIQISGDIVTKIPFGFFGYCHIGKIIKFDKCKMISVINHLDPNYTKNLKDF
jgi:hypothetical protein